MFLNYLETIICLTVLHPMSVSTETVLLSLLKEHWQMLVKDEWQGVCDL